MSVVIVCTIVQDDSVVGVLCVFFFNDTATTEIYTLSLHDALPISHSEFMIVRTTPA